MADVHLLRLTKLAFRMWLVHLTRLEVLLFLPQPVRAMT
jgi:hypothetical protein